MSLLNKNEEEKNIYIFDILISKWQTISIPIQQNPRRPGRFPFGQDLEKYFRPKLRE